MGQYRILTFPIFHECHHTGFKLYSQLIILQHNFRLDILCIFLISYYSNIFSKTLKTVYQKSYYYSFAYSESSIKSPLEYLKLIKSVYFKFGRQDIFVAFLLFFSCCHSHLQQFVKTFTKLYVNKILECFILNVASEWHA